MQTNKLLTAFTLSVSLIGCGGSGSDTPNPKAPQTTGEFLLILERDTSTPSVTVVNGQLQTTAGYNILSIDPSKETNKVSKLNTQLFTQYNSRPYLPIAPNKWANAIVWIEDNKIYGADSNTAKPYLIAENDLITETCEITIEVLL